MKNLLFRGMLFFPVEHGLKNDVIVARGGQSGFSLEFEKPIAMRHKL